MNKVLIQKTSITKLDTDAIVNAANADLQAGGGVCGAIFREAGMQKLQAACDAIGHCSTGSAVITPGFDLKAKYIIHAVGPIWRGGNDGEPQQLYGAYHKALELAVENGCQSIGFPLISAGIYGYPKEQAWDIAIRACADYLKDPCDPDLKVVFAVLDDEIMEIGKKTLTAVAREYRRFAIDNGGFMMRPRSGFDGPCIGTPVPEDKMTQYGWTDQYLTRDGRPWLPVMGEFHFSRYPCRYWKEELEKMKSGGVEIVASYLFWNHHEERPGEIRWDGNRDIHGFLRCCREVGLLAFLRPGPWCHGEARHGGFPDWLLETGWRLRSDDPGYLAAVKRFWSSLFGHVESDLLKNGGPVIGIQIENEYGSGGEGRGNGHIRTLTRLAREIGFDAPYWTATGWGGYVGDLLPVSGGYVEAPWDSSTEELPANDCFIFADKAHLLNIGTYRFDPARFPFLTAELCGGLQVTYNRRPRVSGADTGANSLVKLGSGANLLGYYVYHGGTNPLGERTTLQESRSVGNACDLPALSYDFQAPLREYGSVAASFREIRMLALFLRDFGETLAPMDAVIPDDNPQDPEDTQTLRTAVRTDGHSGFLFINNYQRRRIMKRHENVRLSAGDVEFPKITVLPGDYFFLPFHMKLGNTELLSAAATPLCRLRDGFVFYADRDPQYRWNGPAAKVLTLSREDARNAVRIRFDDEYLLICEQPLVETETGVFCLARSDIELKSFPALPGSEEAEESALVRYALPIPPSNVRLHVCPRMQMNDLYREYELRLEGEITGDDVFLTVDYEGDQAELLLDGRKIADDYYRGEPWEIGLKRWDFPKTMLLRIFAMQKGAPVFTDEPLAYENGRALRLNGVTAQEEFRIRLSPETLFPVHGDR